MKLSDYDYDLPDEYIAQRPLKQRDESKLLVLKDEVVHKKFSGILDYLKTDDVLVLNNTKVIPAKLLGKKTTGSITEILLVKKTGNSYECLIKGKNIKKGTEILIDNSIARVIKKINDKFLIRFDKEVYLNKSGVMPTPPYIKTTLHKPDDYQTVYAKNLGSIAAPTAGFHFTKNLLQKIRKKGVGIVNITLHVSVATFLPIIESDIRKHKMDPEYFEIGINEANVINKRKGGLFVCGTTALKALESSTDKGRIIPIKSQSRLFIKPGYEFKTNTSALITNFHLPRSTLLMLVSAFAGRKKILNAYKQAKKHNYRFYSFGDAMLIFSSSQLSQK